MRQNDNYKLLVDKLDGFTKKYYLNQLIKGALFFVGFVLLTYLLFLYIDYQFEFGISGRKVLFYSLIITSLAALFFWVLRPLFNYFKIGKTISDEGAARIIGEHFSEVEDKLLNVIELQDQLSHTDQTDLINASIDQKSEKIKFVPFKSAIQYSQNKRYLKYSLPPVLLLLLLFLIAPGFIRIGTERLINNGKEFIKPAPFSFVLDDNDLSVIQSNDFPLEVTIEGNELPNEVFIYVNSYKYKLKKIAPDKFSYLFNNVQKNTPFKLFSSGVESKNFTLNVLKKPNILGFEVKLDYPSYTGRKDEALNSTGDIVVPLGTKVDWIFKSENTETINLKFSETNKVFETDRFSDNLFSFQKVAKANENYKIFMSNNELPNADSITYSLGVIPDLYPSISVEKFIDSTNTKLNFFVGEASDDYGLKDLSFNYQIIKYQKDPSENQQVLLNISPSKQIRFDYSFDFSDISLSPGDKLTYYFEIFDNDGINGSKSSRTNLMMISIPTKEEFKALEERNENKIKDDLKTALKESKDIQEELKKLREKLLQEKEIDWQNKKDLENLLKRQKELENKIKDAQENFDENLKNQNEFSETDEETLEKQEKIQELFEEVMSEEMKKLMEEIQKLMEELEREGAIEKIEDFQLNNEEVEMELERMLELFKQLELENEMKEAIENLQELAEEQEQLSEETKDENQSQEELQEKQNEINESFEDIQKQMDEISKKNEELERPKEMEDQKESLENIEQDLKDAQEQLKKNQNQKASQKQKKASDQMKEMANSMTMQMQSQQMEQQMEDMDALRQLLENLVGLSFDQEDLIAQFDQTEINTPGYVDLVQKQFKLKDDFKLIEDSLQALSKRVFQIESFVTEKVSNIKLNIKESLEDLEERRKIQAANRQQRTMKNVNDLALMLSEVLNQMQQEMAGMMQGNQMCTKPGGKSQNGNVPKDKISPSQQQLNEQMKQMQQKMKDGMGGSAEEFAKMAARQAALRKALQDKQNELRKQGKGSPNLQDIIDQMDKVETELVNKKLNNEMLKRQQDILTRLLEHEKAEREREYDNKRKSESAKQLQRKMPPELEEYIKQKEAELEMFKTISPDLKPYYKLLVEEYFKSLKNK